MDFSMEREFAAPIDRVWAAWTEPALLSKWYSPGPNDCRVESLDLRQGGAYRRVMVGPNGDHIDEGIFHAIDAPRRLVQGTPDKQFLIETLLEPTETGTRMVLGMDGVPADSHDHMRGAWGAGFDKLAALLANG